MTKSVHFLLTIYINGKIAFRPFFDIEIEKHRRIRENANRNELKHLILRVDFDKIAELIDDYFISISNSKLNINTVNGATITPPAKINEELVEAVLEFSYTDISNITELKNLIYLITNTDNQTLTDRLNYLNILANSLEKAMSLSNHKLTKAYLNGLYTQIIKWIHETLDMVEWLCNAKYDKLPIDLLKEYSTGGITINQAELEENKNKIDERHKNVSLKTQSHRSSIIKIIT